MAECLFLALPWGCLQFVIVVNPDHTHLLFWITLVSRLKAVLYYMLNKKQTHCIQGHIGEI